MTANSPSSYSVSLMLHGAFAAAVVLTAFVLKDQSLTKQPKILELVAGEGDNWAAIDAPAAGTPTGVKFEPATPAPTPAPVAPQPEPVAPPAAVQPPAPDPVVTAPVERAPITPLPVETVTPKKAEVKKPEPKTFTQMIKQTADRKEKQIVTKFRKEQAAKEKAEAKARELEKLRMTKEDFDRINGKKTALNTKPGTANFQKIDTNGITSGVPGGTTDKPGAGGPALSRGEQDQLETYFALLKQKLRAAHEKPAGVSDLLAARVEFLVAANGAIGQVRIIKSSGNAEFDQSVLAAFSAVRTIGPRPDGRSDKREATFQMKEEE